MGACSLAKYRPIATLFAVKKLFGYVFLRMLPPIKFVSLQTGVAPGSRGASGLYCIKRVAELSREPGIEVYVVQSV